MKHFIICFQQLRALLILLLTIGSTPAWSTGTLWIEDGVLSENGQQFLAELGHNPHGLNPEKYSFAAIQTAVNEENWEQAERLMSSSFDAYLLALRHGETLPDENSEWTVAGDAPMTDAGSSALRAGRSVSETVAAQLPQMPPYRVLQDALADYRRIAADGGWPLLPESKQVLKPGDRHADVAVLRNRLRIGGDFTTSMQADPHYYSAGLAAALKQFQGRHGLIADGMLEQGTRNALNVSVEKRIEQIRRNLERWRWLPQSLGERYIWVNSLAGELTLYDQQEAQLHMRVIAGRATRATPSFSSELEYIVVNPVWTVPRSIAVKDLLPMQQKNPDFLRSKNIRVYSAREALPAEMDIASIDWASLNKNNFPYKLRQDAGPDNSMGRMKFAFPNRFDVYLHGTPNRELFNLPKRLFSSGCIRLESPLELAQRIFAGNTAISKRLDDAYADLQQTRITLLHPLPIYLVYMSAWVDDAGLLQFRQDGYGRDRLIDLGIAN